MYPVIVCIAKFESDYIDEFVNYHLQLGFNHIYIYDNEDTPTYKKLLHNYIDKITVIHLPFNNYSKGVQYVALDNFIEKYLFTTNITHVAHIDIDEFIVLKKHNNICDFIDEYITGDCQGICMNWRMFGSSGKIEKTNEPVTTRFTMCKIKGHKTFKTLYKKDNFIKYNTCHDIVLSDGYIKSTTGNIAVQWINNDIDFSVIQLNHYKCKTFPEFKVIQTRGRADFNKKTHNKQNDRYDNIEKNFKQYDINEMEELTACNFYKNHCLKQNITKEENIVKENIIEEKNDTLQNNIINQELEKQKIERGKGRGRGRGDEYRFRRHFQNK